MESQWSAHDQLAALGADRERAASRMMLPWWHYVAWGVACFAFSNANRVPERELAVYLLLLLGSVSLIVALWRSRRHRQGIRMLPRKSSTSRGRQALNWLAGLGLLAAMVTVMVQVERESTAMLVSGVLAAGVGVGLWIDDRRAAAALRDL